MTTNVAASEGTGVITVALGIGGALLVFAVLTNRSIPLISSDRVALIALVVIGMAMCAQGGIGRVAAASAWAHPLSIIGYVLGIVILTVAAAAILGRELPLIADSRQAIVAVAVLGAIKVGVTALHQLLT